MGLKLFNTLSRSVQEFAPLDPAGKKVGMYCCGPTVYDFAHIGNWRTFVFGDLVRRYLEFKGYAVTHVMNITDVEDKIIKARPRDENHAARVHRQIRSRVSRRFEDAELPSSRTKRRAPRNTSPKSFRSSKNSSRAASPTRPPTARFISASRNIAAAAATTASC